MLRGIEADEIEQSLNLFLASIRRPSEEGWNKANVSFNSPMWEEPTVLLDVSDMTSKGNGILLQGWVALNMNFSCGGLIQSIKQSQTC